MLNRSLVFAVCWLGLLGWPEVLRAAHAAARPGGTFFTIDSWNEDDLPQSSVISMAQTSDGYLWLGTINGLVRFDGLRATVFDEYNTPGLASSPISQLFEDSRGNLWIGTDTDGVIFARDGRVTRLGIGRGSRESRLMSICEDSSGAVWLYTADGQLWRWQNGNTNQFHIVPNWPSSCRAIIVEKSGPMWVGLDRVHFGVNAAASSTNLETIAGLQVGAGRLDFLLASRDGGYWRLADGRIQKWITNSVVLNSGWSYPWNLAVRVKAACEDREGNLIVGTLGDGVWWFDADGNHSHLSTTNGLSNNYVLSVLMDREGALWVGTDGGGLCRVRRRTFDTVESTRGMIVQSVSEASGGLWVGFNNFGGAFGVGLVSNGVLQAFGPTRGLVDPVVRSVFVDQDESVWAGDSAGLFRLKDGRFELLGLPKVGRSAVFAIHQDRTGKLWFGTRAGLAGWDGSQWMNSLTTRGGLPADEVRALAEDREGALWIGTRGGGIGRLQAGKITVFHREDGLPSEDISSLLVDEEGVLWVGTFGSGLARYHAGKWTQYSVRDGLISNSIGYLIDDRLGYLWIGSNKGLMRAGKKALREFAQGASAFVPVRAFNTADGLPTRECTAGSQPAACRTRDGRLWLPTIKGLVSVDPSQIELNTNPPPVVIESVTIDGQARTSGLRARLLETVTMTADNDRIEIEYTSLNLSAPERARFRYRLEGHEPDWIEAGNTRAVHYSGLPHGQYRFQVTACNEDGLWNEAGSALALIVEPPYWKTWWFRSISAVVLLALAGAVINYLWIQKLQRQLANLRQQEALEHERARIARDIHDQLGANLTQVSLLGELVETDKNQPEEVAAHAKQISQTALETSRALDEIVWTVNPRNDTLDGLVNYICKYAQEYLSVAGLRVRLDIPANLPNSPISPEVRHNVFLASKEAITNVVRHAQAASAWLRLKLEPQRFVLEIQDDGRGPVGAKEARAQTRNGLRNMGKRMEDVGGSFEIGPAPERGTLVRLTAPLAKR